MTHQIISWGWHLVFVLCLVMFIHNIVRYRLKKYNFRNLYLALFIGANSYIRALWEERFIYYVYTGLFIAAVILFGIALLIGSLDHNGKDKGKA